jgi:hypothetical protein
MRGSRDTNKRTPRQTARAEASDIIHASGMHVNGCWKIHVIKSQIKKRKKDIWNSFSRSPLRNNPLLNCLGRIF